MIRLLVWIALSSHPNSYRTQKWIGTKTWASAVCVVTYKSNVSVLSTLVSIGASSASVVPCAHVEYDTECKRRSWNQTSRHDTFSCVGFRWQQRLFFLRQTVTTAGTGKVVVVAYSHAHELLRSVRARRRTVSPNEFLLHLFPRTLEASRQTGHHQPESPSFFLFVRWC